MHLHTQQFYAVTTKSRRNIPLTYSKKKTNGELTTAYARLLEFHNRRIYCSEVREGQHLELDAVGGGDGAFGVGSKGTA
jgi:hypothetical protein